MMGFPNVDIFLVKKFIERFNALKEDPGFLIPDLFDDLQPEEQEEIASYVLRKTVTDDIRERTDSELFIFPSFPMFNVPLPQVGISLGNEDTSEQFLDDVVGDATPYPLTGEQTHWDIPKGYWASSNYQIDIVATTKDEVVWISRLLQRFIVEEQDTLDQIGVKEIGITLMDTAIKQDAQPITAFSRALKMSCKVANTWTKRIPINTYEQGVNLFYQ